LRVDIPTYGGIRSSGNKVSRLENVRNDSRGCDMTVMQSSDPVQQAQREYLESRILAAQPAELIEMLYQIAIQSLSKAITHLKSGDAMARSREITRAQEAVNEMMASLDHSVGASFTHTLAALYVYVQQQTLKGHSGPSEEALHRAIGILTTLREGWNGIRAELAQANKAAPSLPHADREWESVEDSRQSVSDRSAEYCQAVPVSSRDWSG
jgi:flagellar secretion chaperone FliS